MKRLFALFGISLMIIAFMGLIVTIPSCKETPCDVKDDISQLKSYRSDIKSEVSKISDELKTKQNELSDLTEKLKELHIYESGRTPQYILKIHLKQSHLSLDLEKHLKDAMNAIDFEIPVDKNFYNQVTIGTEIVDEFRTGSFILSSSIGSWRMTVNGKEIR